MISSPSGRAVWKLNESISGCVGSAMERSSSGSPRDESSEDSWVLFSSEERKVDFPDEAVLPVVGRLSGRSGEDMSSEV